MITKFELVQTKHILLHHQFRTLINLYSHLLNCQNRLTSFSFISGFLQGIFEAASKNNVFKFIGSILLLKVILCRSVYIPFPRVTCFLQLQSVSELTGPAMGIRKKCNCNFILTFVAKCSSLQIFIKLYLKLFQTSSYLTK